MQTRLVLLAIFVVGAGSILGTVIWLKLGPDPRLAGWQQKTLEGLNRYGAVPDFVLLERSGKSIRLADLRGVIWIADFIYTTCTDTCPLQSAEMAKLQEQFAASATKFVSISVDPGKDTPQLLSLYADRYGADSQRWLFLTGDKAQIIQLVQEGFRLSAASAGGSGEVILHSPRFVLIDKETQIRGYYDSRDPEALQRLRNDVATLLNG
jgi:cytochrome oxidase Cu insertion factor (SCO1/SenC/PrrC family)